MINRGLSVLVFAEYTLKFDNNEYSFYLSSRMIIVNRKMKEMPVTPIVEGAFLWFKLVMKSRKIIAKCELARE